MIYRLVLVTTDSPCWDERFIHSLSLPALTLVNKQIHAEALPIYYAENHFYLLLWAEYQGPLPVQDPSRFHRFTRMMEYFGRPTTSPFEQSPLRHIRNIVVQIKLFHPVDPLYYSHIYNTFFGDRSTPEPRYSILCIRGEQQRMAFTGTDQEPFEPTLFRWHEAARILSYQEAAIILSSDEIAVIISSDFLLNCIKDAYDLVKMSFTGRTQSIDEAIREAYQYWQSWERRRSTRYGTIGYISVDSPDGRLTYYDYQ